jgi:predicted  nucleic acid-binding Zn-ribbon protein
LALILVLLLTSWLWWDKLRQVKWVAAECLADAINAKRIADQKALEAINQYNRHIEMCNRVIENQESGLATGAGSQGWQRELRDLQTQLAAERAKSASLESALKNRDETQAKLETRLQQLEKTMLDRQSGANADLVARLQRAEAKLSSRKAARN